ncbi:flagellar hook-basal body complex protein FliE [Nitrospira lenta]|uniref:Flagellar hook-basal body complex protein FliE n=1 Tax=Nitrospira lenta TaxID=1436998 RepID=A0A330L7W2_9BACT|nr:flagellar hook-basal body complex protein FliE [Nitrospira lenta]SPP65213.1 Flagellar hook-basal body complex protein FliE [Nitrospira lenta]
MTPIQGISPILPPIADRIAPVGPADSSASGGFLDSLKNAIGKANDVQLQANQAVDALVTGQSSDLHTTMVALQQADASFQLMMQIRNKLVTAYEEIQRMQV